MGAADGGRGRGLRRHRRAGRRHAVHRARPQSRRSRSRPTPPASRRSAVFAAASESFSRRNINQVDRRVACRRTAASAPRAASGACGSADTSRPLSAVPSKETSRRPASPTSRPRLIDMGASKSRSATRLASRIPGQVPRSSTRSRDADAGSSGSRCTSTTRGGPRSRTC